MTSLEKKLAFSQRKNYEKDFPDLFFDSNIAPIYFPESSQLVHNLMLKLRGVSKKKYEGNLFFPLEDVLEKSSPNLSYFVILPGHSPQQSHVNTKYPALRAEGAGVLKVASKLEFLVEKIDFLSFFAADWSHGFAFDVYAGNPEIHGSDRPIVELAIW